MGSKVVTTTKIDLLPDNRVLLCGRTGCGKTTLVKELLKFMNNFVKIIIVDTKGLWTNRKPFAKNGLGTVETPRLVQSFNPKFNVQVFQTFEWNDALEECCKQILKLGHYIFYIDDIGGLADAYSIPNGIQNIWTMGRANFVGGWASTQYPKRIPKIFKSQAEHFFIFNLVQEDKDDVVKFAQDIRIATQKIANRFFWYFREGSDYATLFSPIAISKRMKT